MNSTYQISVGENVAARLTELALVLNKAGFAKPYGQVITARNSLLDILDDDDACSFGSLGTQKGGTMLHWFPGLEDLFRQNGACEVERAADQDTGRICAFPRP